jgi:prepilin-type processing-associated H-X9-DG protein
MLSSRRMRRGTTVLELVVMAILVAVIALILWPSWSTSGRPTAKQMACLSNLKQLGLSAMMYQSDYGDRLFDRDRWMDLSAPYQKNDTLNHCPNLPKDHPEQYGYAFNSWLALRVNSDLKASEKIPMIYDSINLARSASDPFTSLPEWTVHDEDDRRNVAFADCHARFVRERTSLWSPP